MTGVDQHQTSRLIRAQGGEGSDVQPSERVADEDVRAGHAEMVEKATKLSSGSERPPVHRTLV
jgi:hypothetical protein